MQSTKTLWMLDYRTGEWGHLIPIYAVDEHEAWAEAYHWAVRHDVTLSEDATLVHFPHGFMVYRRVIPGRTLCGFFGLSFDKSL
jgi:hypothetical protein